MRRPSSTTCPAVMSNSRSTARADRGLAAAGFADQRQRLAALDVERHAVDGADERPARAPQAPAQRKMLLEVVDLEAAALMPPPPRPRRSGRRRGGPGALASSAGATCRHSSVTRGQRPANTQPGDALLEARHGAGNLGEPRVGARERRAELAAPRRAGLACRDAAARGTARRPAPPRPCGRHTSPSPARRPPPPRRGRG